MKSYSEWKQERADDAHGITEDTSLADWMVLQEGTTAARYSVEVNYRSKLKEALEAFAKICLGYVSAAMKQSGYHVKHLYEEKPLRILVSTRNFDDGEWVGVVYFHPEHDGGCFIIAKAFYNKEVKTVSLQSRTKCKGTSAAEITTELRNVMHNLKGKPDRHGAGKLKGIQMKRGPKG